MSSQTYRLWIAASLAIGSASLGPVARSQIVPDTSLPLDSISTFENNTWTIEGGTEAGSNLFHSFSDFSLPTDTTASFNNALTVENIITRVTGGNLSNIDGLLRANGTANLFLLNPNGIVFGPNARLEIGGSFVGSTADRLEFADGSSFSATDTATSPLLTVSVPIGLQMGANPGAIEVQGPGHGMRFLEGKFSINRSDRPLGLQVRPGRTLALLGGNIDLLGGNLTATGAGTTAGGRVELGSVAANSRVGLNPITAGWQLGYEAVSAFQDIRLLNTASIDTSGAGAGAIHLQGRSILVRDGSGLVAFNLGAQPSDPITLRATDLVEFRGFDPALSTMEGYPSSILAKVDPEATGRGSDIDVQADRFSVRERAGIFSITSGKNDPNLPGGAGDITIRVEQLRAENGGRITTSTENEQNTGNLTIVATEIDLSGELRPTDAKLPDKSGLFAQVSSPTATGNGGEVRVETDRLAIYNGGDISIATKGRGNAGMLTILARESLILSDRGGIGGVSNLTINEGDGGNGGDIRIFTHFLQLIDGSRISTVTRGKGRAGNINIVAAEIQLSGVEFNRAAQASRIEANTADPPNSPPSTGNGGSIEIVADRLEVSDGARVSVSSDGLGSAGNLQIDAQKIRLDRGLLNADNISGDRGNIILDVRDLRLRNGSSITTDSNSANGGNIAIEAETIAALENSDISANAEAGNGGRVSITTQGLFGTAFRLQPTPASDITATSALGPEFNGAVLILTPDVDPSSGLVKLPETLLDVSQFISDRLCRPDKRSSFSNVGRGGMPPSLEEELAAEIWDEPIVRQPSPPINSQTTSKISDPQSHELLIEAQGWTIGDRGQVILTASPPENFEIDRPRDINSIVCQ